MSQQSSQPPLLIITCMVLIIFTNMNINGHLFLCVFQLPVFILCLSRKKMYDAIMIKCKSAQLNLKCCFGAIWLQFLFGCLVYFYSFIFLHYFCHVYKYFWTSKEYEKETLFQADNTTHFQTIFEIKCLDRINFLHKFYGMNASTFWKKK